MYHKLPRCQTVEVCHKDRLQKRERYRLAVRTDSQQRGLGIDDIYCRFLGNVVHTILTVSFEGDHKRRWSLLPGI